MSGATTAALPDYLRAADAELALAAKTTMTLEIRSLHYSDLPDVAAIERRAFPTPWSIAMFVLEMSKPTGVCLAALLDEKLAGYTICSRYDTVWHVMNIAVEPKLRRRGIASALLAELYVRAGDGDRAVHARGPSLQPGGDRALPARRLPHRRPAAAATTRTTARTR